MFVATYQDMAKGEQLARKAGWDGKDGFLDYVCDDLRMNVSHQFRDREAAISWLQSAINEGKTVFGCGNVTEFEEVPHSQRCDYCTCCGERPVREFTVTDDGIEDEERRDDCAYED